MLDFIDYLINITKTKFCDINEALLKFTCKDIEENIFKNTILYEINKYNIRNIKLIIIKKAILFLINYYENIIKNEYINYCNGKYN